MTEPKIVEMITALDAERRGRFSHGNSLGEISALALGVHDVMGEWLLAAKKGIPIPPEAIMQQRRMMVDIGDYASRLGSEAAASAIALTRIIGPGNIEAPDELPPDMADTVPEIHLDEVAAASDE